MAHSEHTHHSYTVSNSEVNIVAELADFLMKDALKKQTKTDLSQLQVNAFAKIACVEAICSSQTCPIFISIR